MRLQGNLGRDKMGGEGGGGGARLAGKPAGQTRVIVASGQWGIFLSVLYFLVYDETCVYRATNWILSAAPIFHTVWATMCVHFFPSSLQIPTAYSTPAANWNHFSLWQKWVKSEVGQIHPVWNIIKRKQYCSIGQESAPRQLWSEMNSGPWGLTIFLAE